MTYRHFDDFASPPSSGQPSVTTDPQAAKQLQDICQNVTLFCKNVDSLEIMSDRLEEAATPSLSNEIKQLISDTTQLVKITSTSLQKFRFLSKSLSANDKAQFERTMNRFSSYGKRFSKIQKATANIEQKMIQKTRDQRQRAPSSTSFSETGSVPSVAVDDDTSPFTTHDSGMDNNYNSQAQMFSEEDTQIIEQREQEMRTLEHDIVDINEIFRDLGTMVHEQGETIDHIEANVEVASTRVESGNRQLRSAVTAKKMNRKLTCIIIAVVTGVVIVLVIVILIILAATGVFSQGN